MSWADALVDYLPGYYRVDHERVRVIFEAKECMNSYDIVLLLHNVNANEQYGEFMVTFNGDAIACQFFMAIDGSSAKDQIKCSFDGRKRTVFTIAKSTSEAIRNAIEDIRLVEDVCHWFPWSQTDETSP